MIFSFLKKAASPATDLTQKGDPGNSQVAQRHLSLKGRGRAAGAVEGGFLAPAKNCAIWNDIQRALESK